MNLTPEITRASFSDPLSLLHDFSASRPSWNIIDMALSFENAPFTLIVRCLSVENVDSIELEVRI